MPVIFCLVDILTQFRPLFNGQNFALFCTFIVGLITHRHRATLTGIYQAVRPKSGYGSLVKFLSRGQWDADTVAQHLIIVNTRNKGTFTNNSEPPEVSEVPLTRGI